MDAADTFSLVIVRKLQSTPRAIWRALTDPEKLKQWLPDADWEMTSIETHVSVGCRYRVVVNSASAREELTGEYLEVVPHTKLRYTWTVDRAEVQDSVVTFEVAVAGDAAELLLKHAGFASEKARDREELSWKRRIRRLARVLQ